MDNLDVNYKIITEINEELYETLKENKANLEEKDEKIHDLKKTIGLYEIEVEHRNELLEEAKQKYHILEKQSFNEKKILKEIIDELRERNTQKNKIVSDDCSDTEDCNYCDDCEYLYKKVTSSIIVKGCGKNSDTFPYSCDEFRPMRILEE